VQKNYKVFIWCCFKPRDLST